MKFTLKKELPSLLLVAAAWVAGWYFYSHFPEKIVSHWNFYGEPDAWGKGTTNAVAIPSLMTGIYLLFMALPLFDPKKERYEEFKKAYGIFKTAIILVLFLIFLASGLFNLGYNIPIQYVVPAIIGLLMVTLGNYMGKLKPNWFIGIRTPWTLNNENVWNRTHRMGGYAFILFGLLIFLTPFLPKILGLAAFSLGIFVAVFGTIGYSYWVYKQEKAKTN